MIDLRRRLSELDRLEAPDMRGEIERRAADLLALPRDPLIDSTPVPSPWRGPLIALSTAAAILVIVAGLALILRSDTGDVALTSAAPMAATSAAEGPTTVVAADVWDDVVEVAFDGQECVVSGPTSIPAGTGQAFVLTNTSDIPVDLEVATLRDQTLEDLAELPRAADGFVYDDANEIRLRRESFSFDPNDRPAIELTENQTLDVFALSYGSDVIYLVTSDRPTLTQPGSASNGLVTPDGFWFCGQLDVSTNEP